MQQTDIWQTLQERLTPGTRVRNWTVLKGYLGDDFTIESVSRNGIGVNAPNAKHLQLVPEEDFRYMHSIWASYCAGNVPRKKIADNSRFSKYTISILKRLLDNP